MNNSEMVSVVIPCYNHARFLAEAIESVQNQSYQNFEIIVINDGSTDETSRVASNFAEVRLIEQNNQGLSASRNNGLKKCKGEFVVFLDADDTLLQNALETGVKSLKENSSCVCAAGLCKLVDVAGNHLEVIQPAPYSADHYLSLLRGNFIWVPSSVIYRRELFEKLEAFDVDLSQTADYELYLRIARNYSIFQHSNIVTNYRQHATSMSRDYQSMLNSILQVCDRQKEFTSDNKNYRKALKHGISFYKSFYGNLYLQVVYSQFSQSIKRGNFNESIKYGVVLLSYPMKMPKLFYKLLRLKLKIITHI